MATPIASTVAAIHARGEYPSMPKVCAELELTRKALKPKEVAEWRAAMKQFGIKISRRGQAIRVKGKQG